MVPDPAQGIFMPATIDARPAIRMLHVESNAFPQEYDRGINPVALRKDIESYLGEYRLHVPIYDYALSYSFGKDESRHLRSIDDDESMLDKGIKAINRKKEEGKNTNREEAELQGFHLLERQLVTSHTGDVLVWASPPGPKNEGYGDYGFFYVGVLSPGKQNGDIHLNMRAIRVENPNIDQFNQALSGISGYGFGFDKAEDFLAHPMILDSVKSDVLQALHDVFGFVPDQLKLDKFRQVTEILQPRVQEFIRMVKMDLPKDELLRQFHILENMADDLRINADHIDSNQWQAIPPELLLARYDHQPTFVGGSCGGSAKSSNPIDNSNDIINSLSSLSELFKDKKDKNICSICHKSSSDNHYHCDKCQHSYADETDKSHDQRTPACVECGRKFGC